MQVVLDRPVPAHRSGEHFGVRPQAADVEARRAGHRPSTDLPLAEDHPAAAQAGELRVLVGQRLGSPNDCRGSPMGRKLYVGNLTYDVTDSGLEQMFAAHGTVQSAQVIMDRETNRSKGFGFVEMGSDQEAQAAIQALNAKEVDGRALTVNEAKPREDRGG